MTIYDKYETVIGLEVHAQLSTKSKAFCADSAEYGGAPNTHISPISLGHPGTLPYFNEQVLDYAIKMGLACHCEITPVNQFARKNYFYADLPKGYQITQFDTPICSGGYVEIEVNGEKKQIALTRIHMEEDAGKSTHDLDPYYSLIDLNRAGVPLIEIVSEPDIRSSDEAYAYLTEIRKLVRYLEICDGNMEEGSMRCDANISVRLKGAKEFGERSEVKNMNSMRNVKRAIEHEVKRQVDLIESGGRIVKETRSFNAVDGSTFSLRTKEEANDYRYFPEPDLPPFIVTENILSAIRREMPALPKELLHKFTEQLGLSAYDARVLTDEKEVALFFDDLITKTSNYKAAANWVTGAVKSYLNENAVEMEHFPLNTTQIAELIRIIDEGKVSHTIASQQIFPELLKQPGKMPLQLAEELNLLQQSDVEFITGVIQKVLDNNPNEVERYKAGNKALTGFFMGQVMKATGGKADPKAANKLLMEMLNTQNVHMDQLDQLVYEEEDVKDSQLYEGDDDSLDQDISFTEYEISASPNDFNIRTLFDFIDSGIVKIPGFQRNYVWDIKRASKLIESLLIGIPIPQIFLYEEGKNSFLVIDGQQRYFTIYFFKKKRFPKKEKRFELRRIFEESKGIPDEILSNNEFFVDFNLQLPDQLPNQKNKFNKLNYFTLSEEDRTALDLRTIRNIIIKQNSPDDGDTVVFEIFNRLNSGGVNLKPQEIRTSLYHSAFYEMLYKVNLDTNWRALTPQSAPDLNMKDVEILLRGFAMLTNYEEYKPSLTKFLNTFSSKAKKFANGEIQKFEKLFIEFARVTSQFDKRIFFSKAERFNISIFEAVFVALCEDAYKNGNVNIKSTTLEKVKQLKEDREFIKATQSNTSSRANVGLRITKAKTFLPI